MSTHADRFARLVDAYLASADEQPLLEAAVLGRELVAADVPPEVLGELQEQALASLAARRPELRLGECVEGISGPLIELLMAYGLAFRDRLARESELALMNAAVDGLSASVAILDDAGRVQAVNRAWRESTAPNPLVPADARRGLDYLRHCERAPDDHALAGRALADGVREVRDGLAAHHREEYASAHGRWYAVRVNRSGGPGRPSLVVAHEDITTRKRAEHEARAQQAALERAVAIRTRDLEAFTWSASHELRSPLRSIAGLSDLLWEDHADQIGEDGQTLLQRIAVNVGQLSDRIDALVALSQLTQRPIEWARVDLSALAESVAAELTAGGHRAVDFEIRPDLITEGDPELLRVMLVQLIGNAWKFTRHADRAHIEIGLDGMGWAFVRDNGVGFDMDHAEHLFRPFRRLHRHDEFAGAGLGLATTQRIVVRHGGHLEASGRAGEGATFRFTHPFRQAV